MKRYIILIVLLAASCCFSAYGQEQKFENKWFGGAGGGMNFGIDGTSVDSRANSHRGAGTAIDAWVGKRINDWLGFGAGYHGLSISDRYVEYGQYPFHYIHADAMLMHSRYIMPYVHAGMARIDKMSPAGGVGVKVPIPINDILSIVPDVKLTAFSGRAITGNKGLIADAGVTLGLAFNLGRPHKKKTVETPYVAPKPTPVVVPDNKPEQPEVVPEPEPEPAPAIDTVLVKKSEEFTAKIAGVTLFDFDRSNIRPEAIPVLDEIAAWLLENPERTALIEGYTDSRGSDAYNLVLSQKRAESVRDYLVGNGVAKERLTAEGHGKGHFTEGDTKAEVYQQNRRVVITLK